MRALGFYPTEQDVDDLVNQVKFGKFVDEGIETEEIDFEEIIKRIQLTVAHSLQFMLTTVLSLD